MSNEEKAKEIAQRSVYNFYEARDSALKMAEWKDRQFKEYLSEKRKGVISAINKCTRNTVKEYSLVMVREYFDDIIDELFPMNAEQDNSDRDE